MAWFKQPGWIVRLTYSFGIPSTLAGSFFHHEIHILSSIDRIMHAYGETQFAPGIGSIPIEMKKNKYNKIKENIHK